MKMLFQAGFTILPKKGSIEELFGEDLVVLRNCRTPGLELSMRLSVYFCFRNSMVVVGGTAM